MIGIMLDPKKFLLTWWDKVRMGIGLICVIMVFVQFGAAAKMMTENYTELPKISPEQYDNLQISDVVAGTINKEDVLMTFEGKNSELRYYLVKVNSEHAVVMKAPFDGEGAGALSSLLRGEKDSIDYKGVVNLLTEADQAIVNLNVISGDVLYKHGMSRYVNEVLLGYTMDVTTYEFRNMTKYIIVTIIGGFLMIAAAVWAFRRPFGKIGMQYAARMGKIDLGLTTKEELPIEQGWFTEEDSKKIETDEHPIRFNPCDTEPIDFYESGMNEEGNFYIKKKEEPPLPPDAEGFVHEHKNY